MAAFNPIERVTTPTPRRSGDTIHIMNAVGHARKSHPNGDELMMLAAKRSRAMSTIGISAPITLHIPTCQIISSLG